MSKLSRRSFLKGTAVSALGAAALGMTACSNNTAASSTASSAAASAPASSTPAQQPAAAETGKPGFFTDPYQYKDTDAVQVVTTEVVVVGAGNAGCTAACSCVENGSEVVVIEAQNAIHGQGGGVGLCNTKYVQSLVDEGKLPHMTDVVEHQNIWVQRCGSRVNEALVSMWFNNSPEAGNWLIDKCAEFGVVPVSFRAHAPNAIIPESYDYHMFVNVGDHQFDSKCGYFAATNVLYEDSQNAEKYEHPATYFFNTKAQELLVEDGRVPGVFAQRDGELWLFRATKGADDDFHNPADFLYPVVKAPFYAAKVGVALLAVVGGLSVNTDLQVLDDEKKPIEGLYATGNTSGDLYAIDYPINMAGNTNGRCVIWGYLLGKTMAKATASGEALTSRDELADLAKDENGIVASDTVYKDGSYTGTGKGRGGDMEVTVTITDGKISDIVVNSHAESSDIGAPALDKLIQNAIAANSAEIDGASGATMTSDGFREAVAQALAKAQ